jgi:hypothetical protein
LLFVVGMASVERFLPRPEVVTFAMIPWFYHLLARGRLRTFRDLVVLGVLQVVWANSHGLFVIGPFMVGTYLLGTVVVRLRGGQSDCAPAAWALLVVLGATLLTPFGFAGWSYALLLMTEAGTGGPEVMRTLGELSPTFGTSARSGQAFWFFLLLMLLSGGGCVRAIVRIRLNPRMMIVAAMCAAAMSGRRNIVLFVLVAAPFVAETLGDLRVLDRRVGRLAIIGVTAVIVGWSWLPLAGAYYVHMEIPARARLGVTPSFFPHDLPAFLDDVGFTGKVLNSNTIGGFHLYHGYPDRLPLTDGRWETYDSVVLERVRLATQSSEDWRWVVERFGLEGILLAHTSPEATAMLPALIEAPEWRLVYFDGAASFWVPDEGQESPPEIRPESASLPEIRRVDDGLILNSFLASVGATEARIANLARTLRFGRRQEFILEQLGPLQLEVGRFDDAEATFEALLELDRKNDSAYNELAFLAFRRGDLERAQELIGAALKFDPSNPKYRENLQRVQHALEQSRDRTGGGT